MKALIIGGNRFVGLRLAMALDQDSSVDLTILNRTGQAPHLKNAAIFKGDRRNLTLAGVDPDWDVIVDFANYDELDTESALKHFNNVGRYIFISTASVYDEGADRAESHFDAKLWTPSATLPASGTVERYQEGKRRAESAFAKTATFPVVSVRFPFILGPDDYTRRLEFHVERVERNQTLFVPNLDARISMIHSEDAAAFLRWSLTEKFSGPVNVASPHPLAMGALLAEIEARVGHRPLLVQGPTPQNRSPYGPRNDSFLNCDHAKTLGFTARPTNAWLGELIDGALQKPPPKTLH